MVCTFLTKKMNIKAGLGVIDSLRFRFSHKMSLDRWHAYYRCRYCGSQHSTIISTYNTPMYCSYCEVMNLPFQQVYFLFNFIKDFIWFDFEFFHWLQLHFEVGQSVPNRWLSLRHQLQPPDVNERNIDNQSIFLLVKLSIWINWLKNRKIFRKNVKTNLKFFILS